MNADLFLHNGIIYTYDAGYARVSAVAIKDGQIIAVGMDESLKEWKSRAGRVIDLEGKTVFPGFTDTHAHFMDTGNDMLFADLTSAKSMTEILGIMKAFGKTLSTGQWILGRGFDDSMIVEKRFPTMQELDTVSPVEPVVIFRVDLHSCIVNTAGYRRLALDENLDGIEKDHHGKPTGTLLRQATGAAFSRINQTMTDDQRRQGIRLASQFAVAHGITEVHCLEGGGAIADHDLEILRSERNRLPLRTTIYHQTTDVKKVKQEGACCIGGCVLIDGSIGSRTAAVTQPFKDDPLNEHNQGVLYFSEAELNEFVEEAHRNDLQISMHAIGDRAIGQLLSAYERVLTKYPRKNHRHRLEHFELCTQAQIEKSAQLGIVLAMQPAFDYLWGGSGRMYESRLGLERSLFSNPFGSILKAGCIVAGGSDSDVTPMDPLLGIHSAVNHRNPEQRISVNDAILMYTRNAAWAAFKEASRGSIEVGKQADLTVLAKDPFKTPVTELKDIPYAMTICRGKTMYSE